jgi:hypothetical protein
MKAGVWMMQSRCVRAAMGAAGAVAAVLGVVNSAKAALPPYALVGSFALPAGAPGDFNPVPVDVLPDGRLIGIASDGRILVQTAVNAGTYVQAGAIDGAVFDGAFGNFGASFISVSPDGSRLAIGDNGAFNRVHFVDTGSLAPIATSPTVFAAAPNFDGAWADGSSLYVSGFGSAAGVWRIDVAGLTSTQVVSNATGGAGGIAIRGGHIFAGDGFNTADGGAPTGNVRAFDLAALAGAGSAVSFDIGTLVADALSASPVRFDSAGNMLIGGGDFFAGSSDFGFAAVVDSEAILAALEGGPLAPDSAELRLSPAGGFAYYGVEFNEFTGEVLVFADGTAYRYAVPAPACLSLLALGGVAAMRRRRGA